MQQRQPLTKIQPTAIARLAQSPLERAVEKQCRAIHVGEHSIAFAPPLRIETVLELRPLRIGQRRLQRREKTDLSNMMLTIEKLFEMLEIMQRKLEAALIIEQRDASFATRRQCQ